jgi:hypothetical protein
MSPTKMTAWDSAMQAPEEQHSISYQMSTFFSNNRIFLLYIISFFILAAYFYLRRGKSCARTSMTTTTTSSWGEYDEDEEAPAPLTGKNTTAHGEDGWDADAQRLASHRPAAAQTDRANLEGISTNFTEGKV